MHAINPIPTRTDARPGSRAGAEVSIAYVSKRYGRRSGRRRRFPHNPIRRIRGVIASAALRAFSNASVRWLTFVKAILSLQGVVRSADSFARFSISFVKMGLLEASVAFSLLFVLLMADDRPYGHDRWCSSLGRTLRL